MRKIITSVLLLSVVAVSAPASGEGRRAMDAYPWPPFRRPPEGKVWIHNVRPVVGSRTPIRWQSMRGSHVDSRFSLIRVEHLRAGRWTAVAEGVPLATRRATWDPRTFHPGQARPHRLRLAVEGTAVRSEPVTIWVDHKPPDVEPTAPQPGGVYADGKRVGDAPIAVVFGKLWPSARLIDTPTNCGWTYWRIATSVWTLEPVDWEFDFGVSPGRYTLTPIAKDCGGNVTEGEAFDVLGLPGGEQLPFPTTGRIARDRIFELLGEVGR